MKRANSESPSSCDKDLGNFNLKKKFKPCVPEDHVYGILDLSDDVLLCILNYLSKFDLMSLHLSCMRLFSLCHDRTLWKEIDLRDRHVPFDELKKFVKFFQPVTKILALRGNKIKDELPEIQQSFLNIVGEKCKQLEDFYLEEYSICREQVEITHFPKTLKKLSLKSSQVVNISNSSDRSYLFNMNTHMPNLTSLILTNCEWLDSYSIMPISKIPQLKEVRLNSCYGLEEDVAYASLATRFGLKSLEVLDLRDTFIGDSVISSFNHTPTLLELYLECPSSETIEEQENTRHLRQRNNQNVYVVQISRENQQVRYANCSNTIRNLANNVDRCQISDRSLCTLALCDNRNNPEILNSHEQVQLIRGGPRKATNPNFRKLVVRNYPLVTNQTLLHFSVNGPKLEYLDVTGTSVTKEGLQNFKNHRPDVTIISSFEET